MVATNPNTKKKVEVLLMGQRFTVRSDRDEKYIDQLSRIVNEQFDDIRRNTRTISTHHVALLASLNLADELMRTKETLAKADELKQSLTKKTQETLQEVESVLAFLPAEWRSRDETPKPEIEIESTDDKSAFSR